MLHFVPVKTIFPFHFAECRCSAHFAGPTLTHGRTPHRLFRVITSNVTLILGHPFVSPLLCKFAMSLPTPEQLCIRFNEIKLPTDKDSSSSPVAVSSGDDDSSGVQSSGVQSSIGFDLLVVEVARDVSEFRPIDGSDEAQEGVDRIMHYYHGQQAFVLGTLLRQPKCRSALPWSYPELSTSELNVSDDPWKIDYTCYDILNVNCNLVTYLITNRPDMGPSFDEFSCSRFFEDSLPPTSMLTTTPRSSSTAHSHTAETPTTHSTGRSRRKQGSCGPLGGAPSSSSAQACQSTYVTARRNTSNVWRTTSTTAVTSSHSART